MSRFHVSLPAMKPTSTILFALMAAISLAGPPTSAHAQDLPDTFGDIFPPDNSPPDHPSWDWSPKGVFVGYVGAGSMTIPGISYDSTSLSGLYIGYYSTAAGTVSVVGGTWSTSPLYVGGYGTGSLSVSGTVTGGSHISTGVHDTYIGYGSGSSGTVTISNSTWNSYGSEYGCLYVGRAGSGTLQIDTGASVMTADVHLGYLGGSTGSGTITGSGSSWAVYGSLYVGNSGSGALTIGSGGSVSVATATFVGLNSGSTGTIAFDGGTLTTRTLFASPSQLTGSGSITAYGLVSDRGLLFDGNDQDHGLVQTFQLGGSTITLDMTSSPHGDLGAGWNGTGSLVIQGTSSSISVTCATGYLGYHPGSVGTAIVSGAGSGWGCSELYVGYGGAGTLSVSAGGSVSGGLIIGHLPGSTGSVNISGSTSKVSRGAVLVGDSGTGTLVVENGAWLLGRNACCIGNSPDSAGVLTVDGTPINGVSARFGNENGPLYVGRAGSGTLNILNGARGSIAAETFVGAEEGSTGTIHFDGGGTLITSSLFASPSQITGGGTISTGGLVSDVVLSFSPNTPYPYRPDGFGSTVVYVGSSGALGAGYLGVGYLTISGVEINSHAFFAGAGYFGYHSGSHGYGSVTASAQWALNEPLYVGYYGAGNLTIDAGGRVGSYQERLYGSDCYLGYAPNSTGAVTVSGSGSFLYCHTLYVGNSGSGALTINNANVSCGSSATGPLYDCYVGLAGGSNSGIGFGGGTLTTKTLWASPDQLSGTGTISARGLVSDYSLSLNSGNLDQTFNITPGISLHLNMSPYPNHAGSLGVGWYGSTATLTIGCPLSSEGGYFGYHSDAVGAGTVSGSSTAWNSGPLYVGYGGSGSLLIHDGGSVYPNTDTNLGCNSGASGTLTVSGSGSYISCGTLYTLYVGNSGSGVLNIDSGGYVYAGTVSMGDSTGSSGSGTVTGAGSELYCGYYLYVGNSGSGSLTVSNGGFVRAIDCRIGALPGSAGTITVEGVSSTLSCGYPLYVGDFGTGTLRVTGGARLAADAYVGRNAGSTGTVEVSGSGSTWTIGSSALHIGCEGNGTLTIAQGGAVVKGGLYESNAPFFLGYYVGSAGSATLADSGSTWTTYGDLCVGYGGTGTVTQTGGTNSVVGTLCLGCYSAGSGTYNLNGGVLALVAMEKGDGTASFNFGSGTIRADANFTTNMPMNLTSEPNGNGVVNTNGHDVTFSGVLSGSGGITKSGSGTLTFSGSNTYTGTTVVAQGTLKLSGSGAWDPVFDLGGADVQVGHLVFDYSAGGTGTDPQSTILSELTASGTTSTPWTSGQFRSSTASTNHTTLGWIDNATSSPIVSGSNTFPAYSVTVMAALAGDANLDGKVDGTDYAIVIGHYNQVGVWVQGDFNYDGVVNSADYTLVIGNYNRSFASAPILLAGVGVSPVPEPGTLAMLAAGLIALALCAWRKRR